MKIHAITSSTVELRGADNFTQFEIVAPADVVANDEAFGVLVRQLGSAVDTQHIYVSVDRLKALAGSLADDQQWLESLEKMMEYAADHGWVNDSGQIRAHITVSADQP